MISHNTGAMPIHLIHRCLSKVKMQSAEVVLITPPIALELLEDYPWILLALLDLIVMLAGQNETGN